LDRTPERSGADIFQEDTIVKVTNHKLVGADNKMVPFVKTPHGGNALSGGRPRFLVIHYTAGE
jgi:hypothetical protein